MELKFSKSQGWYHNFAIVRLSNKEFQFKKRKKVLIFILGWLSQKSKHL